MPGRPDFSQEGTLGGGQTVAVNQRPEVVEQIVDMESVTVGAGEQYLAEVYAPTGSVYELMTIRLNAAKPSYDGATSGTHAFYVIDGATNTSIRFAKAQAGYDQILLYTDASWNVNADPAPPSEGAFMDSLQRIRATENRPVAIKYVNDTDAATTQVDDIELIFEEVSY